MEFVLIVSKIEKIGYSEAIASMKETILLVDDESIFNFISTKVLEGLGVSDEIHSALNGNAALGLINDYLSRSRSLPRLILVDINMPVMDGFDFIYAFQSLDVHHKRTTILAILSSSVSQYDRDRALTLGIEHFLTKPLSEADLKKVLAAAGISFR